MLQKNQHQVCILLAVWGEEFITEFLRLSLPSLLAPGNIPAMAQAYPLRFVFLTRTQDQEVFEDSMALRALKSICTVEFIAIEDLIVFNNYSTTLTLAYDRAITQTGEQMLNTYFVFLTSDYIMADGSLTGLMRYIKKGYSGICAGNFQVNSEEIEPFLLNNIDRSTGALAIKPRELLKQSFQYLHPIVFASIIDQNVLHNYKVNRFYFRPDNEMIAGRFYLLHMLCIKPETTNYQIGASCDYSFIPEMCPSGNIAIINDSDDYLVIEVQSTSHEINYLNWGGYDFKELTSALSEWTTAQHRKNANTSIYFHITDISPAKRASAEERLNHFIHQQLASLQSYKEKPYRNHPYWIGAIQSFTLQHKVLTQNNYYEYLNSFTWRHLSHSKKLYYYLFGTPPKVFPWHRRFFEFRSLMKIIKTHVSSETSDNTVAVYDSYQQDFMWYASWLKDDLNISYHYYLKNLMVSSSSNKALLQNGQFELCLFFMTNMKELKQFISIVKPFLKPNNKILIIFFNEDNRYADLFYDFAGELIQKFNFTTETQYHIVNVDTIHDNLAMIGDITLDRIGRVFSHSRKMRFLFYFLFGLPGSLWCLIRNSLSILRNKKRGHCTNILLTLVPNEPK